MVIVQRWRGAPVSLSQKLRGWPWTPAKRLPRRWRQRQDWPRITVVTPSFNQGVFLEATLRSVLLQNYPNLEYIVIDGASHDTSIDVLKHYHPYLSYWVSERDRGQAHAINKGLRRSTGEILGWLNSDDLLLPHSLFHIAERFLEQREPRAVTGLRQVIDGEGRHLRHWIRDLPQARYLKRYCCIAQETTYWHREVFEKLGSLDESFHFALDYEYWLRLLENGFGFEQVPQYLGAFREHAASKTTNLGLVYQQESQRLYRRYDLGRNEEDVLSQLGEIWNWRRALIEDLCETRWFDHPRLATAFLNWLEKPGRSARAVSVYRRFRLYHPRSGDQNGRWRALWRAVKEETRDEPIFDDHEPHLFPANPVARPRLTWEEARDHGVATWPVDGLAVGAGWSWVEKTKALSYRWAENDAEILITHPSGRRKQLRLRLETGPSLEWRPFALQVIDECDQVIAQRELQTKEDWILKLDLERSVLRCLRLRVESQDRPASSEDPRILNFRLIGLSWEEDSPLFDLPNRGRTAQVVLETQDIVPSSAIVQLEERRQRREPPEHGLFLGHGWLAPEVFENRLCRRAYGDCELVICCTGRPEAEIEIEADLGVTDGVEDGLAPGSLTVQDGAGQEIADAILINRESMELGAERLALRLPVENPVSVFRLRIHAPGEVDRFRAWRVYSIRLVV